MRSIAFRIGLGCLLLLVGVCRGQGVPATAQGVLVEIGSRAGVIFSGRVLAVDRQDANGYVDVRFRVEHGVRGCAGSTVYVLREWAGLWTGQAERYRVGERRLMLLTARGPSGMSAPVDGMNGAIPLRAGVQPPRMDGLGGVTADTAVDGAAGENWLVDLRWVQARALRGSAGRSAQDGQKVQDGQEVQGGQAAWIGPVRALYGPGLLSPETRLDAVLGWLGTSAGVEPVQAE